MLGKRLVQNLKHYLTPIFTIPVYTFDQNVTRELPCLVVGYTDESPSFLGCFGHYTVNATIDIVYQGYEDTTNVNADNISELVVSSLQTNTMYLSVNKPLSGTDTRPLSGFCLNGLIIRGVERINEDHSTCVQVKFDCYTAGKD